MSERLRVGVSQMNSGTEVQANTSHMSSTLAEMASDGVQLAFFPENATVLAPAAERLQCADDLDGAQLAPVREACAKHGIAALVGSFVERGPDAGHSYNTSVLIDEAGAVSATYRKIHLFDVTVDSDTTFRESDTVAGGEPQAVVASVAGWKVGLSICYDLRFPELYRAISAAGADVLAIPAAFTFRTGAAHWDVLLRARAIENLTYVVASAQVGRHYGQRESYGHSQVISPWGTVVTQSDDGVGWFASTLERRRLREARAAIPCLSARRM